MNENERNDLQTTITHALQEMKAEAGDSQDIRIKRISKLVATAYFICCGLIFAHQCITVYVIYYKGGM